MYELIEKRNMLFTKLHMLEENGIVKEAIVSKLRVLIAKDYTRLLKSFNSSPTSVFNKKLLRHVRMMERLIWDAVKQIQLNELREIGAVKGQHKFVNQKEARW